MLTEYDIDQQRLDRELAERRSREGQLEYALRQIAVGSADALTRGYADAILNNRLSEYDPSPFTKEVLA